MPGMGNPEMVTAAMEMMRNKPDLLRSALNMNPALAGRVNPEMAEQVISWFKIFSMSERLHVISLRFVMEINSECFVFL